MKTISLCGTWQCQGSTGEHGGIHTWPVTQPFTPTYPMQVPGTVQEAFEHLTGDVHVGHNVYLARFIEEQYWLCSRDFELTEEDLAKGNRVRLVFEGLELCAHFYLNGKHVGKHTDAYLPARIDVTEHAVVGTNHIDIRLDTGIYEYGEKDTSTTYCNSYTAKILKRVYARHAQSQYEWDWAPRLLNVGIVKPCYVEIAPFFINETAVYHRLNANYSRATLDIRQFLAVTGERKLRVDARVEETGDAWGWEGEFKGASPVRLTLNIENPKLWYPRGYGEQFRYTLTVTITDLESGAVIGTVTKKVGLRHVEIDQSAREDVGRNFKLLINGRQLFAKGGNMIPLDILYSRFTRDRYELLIDRAVENNFNALRVWGGGIYETDDFYDLCDERGIVVWQDFIGACASYPAFDEDFMKNYLAELRYNIRRMSSYASLVIYCGNNEIDQFSAAGHDGWVGRYCQYTDASLYYVLAPRLLREEGDHHYYQPSSPWSPDGDRPTDYQTGDQHPWAIGFANRDYFQYRKMDCRFPNEGGMLGPTSLPCIMTSLSEGQQYLHSLDYKLHDNSVADWRDGEPIYMLKEKLGFDVKLHDGLSIPDYTYYGGFLHGEGLTEYIINFRRRMNDTTGSAIFWMYNDCWPATRSWTTVDFLGNRTPAFWSTRRAFAPVAVDIVKTENGFDFYGISERLEAKAAKLSYGYMLPDGTVDVKEIEVTLPVNSSAVLASLDGATLPEGAILIAELDAEGEPLARRRWVEVPYNELGLGATDIKVTKNADGTATYLAQRPVLGVCLDLDGEDGELSDNFFDLYPGRPYTVKLGSKSGEVLYSYMGQGYCVK